MIYYISCKDAWQTRYFRMKIAISRKQFSSYPRLISFRKNKKQFKLRKLKVRMSVFIILSIYWHIYTLQLCCNYFVYCTIFKLRKLWCIDLLMGSIIWGKAQNIEICLSRIILKRISPLAETRQILSKDLPVKNYNF